MEPVTRPRRIWLEPTPIDVPETLREAVGGHQLVAESLARRGITELAAARRFLSAAQYQPAPAAELPDIDRAVERLRRAISGREQILIWGDFDVDGQTSTALLSEALTKHGARVQYHVPNRFSEGHGIHPPTLKRWLDGGVDLLLTCDTGVAAHEAVAYATVRGVDVIITDHHALPAQLPEAVAVVNPRRLPAGHALRELPGVGVAYKLIEALNQGEDCEQLLDLVALGIVADVMVQVDDTRFLLQRGLEALRRGQRPGLRAICEWAGIRAGQLNEGDIGFGIAPRLNALGRLDDATPAVELLTTADAERARALAQSLERHNSRRKFLSSQVYQSALAQIEARPELLEYAGLVLSQDDWHSGVIGIVAGRLAEEYGRPTVLIATPDDKGRGSARSREGWDITAAFGKVAGYLDRYGGHSMAAGLSLPAANIFAFRRALSGVLREMGGEAPAAPTLGIDAYVDLSEISLDLARELERLAPFGNGNPPLTLAARDLKLRRRAGLGRRGEHLQLDVEDEAGVAQRVIWWRGAGQPLPAGRFDLAFTLRSSAYKGEVEAVVEWQDFRERETAALDVQTPSPWEIVDYRAGVDPRAKLARAQREFPEALVWAEAASLAGAVDRLQLREAETLIVWTAPPSAEIWSAGLTAVNPARLVLFGGRPDQASRATLLPRLAARVKFALNQRGGAASLEALAAALAERERTVQAGLALLRAMGLLEYSVRRSGRLQLRRAEAASGDNLPALQKRLDLLLGETRAYRDYWLKMSL